MAGRLPPELIDQLLARTDLVELIGSRLQLRKAGREFQAHCPFHVEKRRRFMSVRSSSFITASAVAHTVPPSAF